MKGVEGGYIIGTSAPEILSQNQNSDTDKYLKIIYLNINLTIYPKQHLL